MELKLSCAMCGVEKTVPACTDKADTTTIKAMVERAVQDTSWQVQQNGRHLDIYCSPRCAQ